MPAQGTPEGQRGRGVLHDGQPDAVSAVVTEPVLDEASQPSADTLAVKAAVHEQQPNPGMAIRGMLVKQAQQANEPALPVAGDQDLAALTAASSRRSA